MATGEQPVGGRRWGILTPLVVGAWPGGPWQPDPRAARPRGLARGSRRRSRVWSRQSWTHARKRNADDVAYLGQFFTGCEVVIFCWARFQGSPGPTCSMALFTSPISCWLLFLPILPPACFFYPHSDQIQLLRPCLVRKNFGFWLL